MPLARACASSSASEERSRLVVDEKQLENSGAALVSGRAARIAAGSPEQFGHGVAVGALKQLALGSVGRMCAPACGTQVPHKPLSEHAEQARGDEERLDPHVDQPHHGTGGVVGVQGREHQVPGETRLHRDLRGLQVADLADHDHVGVLAQDGAQCPRKSEIDARIDLGLADAVEVVLDRVLDGNDIAALGVELAERGVKRGRLSRPGRPCDQNDAVRLPDEVAQGRERRIGHAQAGEVQPSGLLVEQAQHHALAVRGRQDRNAHIHRAPGKAQRDTPVLRLALLGDIQARHDLDARYDHAVHHLRRLEHVAQHPVPAEAHHRAPLEGLDVDVGSVLAHRLGEQRVDQPHDGRVVLALQEVGDLGKALGERGEVGTRVQVGDNIGGVRGAALVGARERRVEGLFRELPHRERTAERALHLGERAGAHSGPDPQLEALIELPRADHAVPLGERVRQAFHRARIRRQGVRGHVHGPIREGPAPAVSARRDSAAPVPHPV